MLDIHLYYIHKLYKKSMFILNQITDTDTAKGKVNQKRYIVVHTTASKPNTTFQNILKFFKKKDYLSVHYTISYQGDIVQLAKDDAVCYHAGISQWMNDKDLNNCSIGIEVFDNGQPFTDIQRENTIELCAMICRRWKIPVSKVLPHSTVAYPRGRKSDPPKSFYKDWSEFQDKIDEKI